MTVAILVVVACGADTGGEQANSTTLTNILNAEDLWGRDFGAALAYSGSWERVGESAIAIFADRIVGVASESTGELRSRASQLARFLREPQLAPLDAFRKLRDELEQPPVFNSATVEFDDDASSRLAWTTTERPLEFLRPGLTMQTVRDSIGEPEATTRELVQTERDIRPIVLIQHEYAGGAVTYVETDISPIPGLVDRVILDTQAVVAAVFEVGR